MSEELQTAAHNHSVNICTEYQYGESDMLNVPEQLEQAFKAGAAWHKSRAFLEIIKDIQKSGGILIVEPSGGVSVDPNAGGGVNFTRIKESAIFPEIPPAIFPEILENPLKAKDFTFPGGFTGKPGNRYGKNGFTGKPGKRHR